MGCKLIGWLSAAIVLAAPSLAHAAGGNIHHRSDFRITGYLPWYSASHIPQIHFEYLTDVIYFSMGVTSDGGIDQRQINNDVLDNLVRIGQASDTQVHVSLGGGGGDFGFSNVVGDAAKRDRLARALRDFALAHDIDGIDLDWEPFGHPDSDFEDYSRLMTAIHKQLAPHRLELSVAVPRPNAWVKPFAYNSVNNFHVMSYDHGTPHSSFEDSQIDIAQWQALGVPDDKINLGVPFYGRNADRQAYAYSDLVAAYAPPPESDEAGGVFFNGIKTIQRKARYAFDLGLGGVMIWQLGLDTFDDTSLLKALHDAIYQPGSIAIRNGSFEYTDVIDSGNPRGIDHYDTPTAWKVGGPARSDVGVFDPGDRQFELTRGNNIQGSLPDGGQIGFVEDGSGVEDSTTLEKQLAVDAEPGAIYTLRFSVGRRADMNIGTDYAVQLLADDASVASWSNPVTPAAGTFEPVELIYTSAPDAEGELGIRFLANDGEQRYSQTFFDAVSLGVQLVGDLDDNGVVDAFDVDDFELALADRQAYLGAHAGLVPDLIGDLDGSGKIDAFDVDDFERLLAGSGISVPEPHAMVAIGLAMFLFPRRRRLVIMRA